jgi:antitoxin component YwqK of YwqJK toxin-antitoxin module
MSKINLKRKRTHINNEYELDKYGEVVRNVPICEYALGIFRITDKICKFSNDLQTIKSLLKVNKKLRYMPIVVDLKNIRYTNPPWSDEIIIIKDVKNQIYNYAFIYKGTRINYIAHGYITFYRNYIQTTDLIKKEYPCMTYKYKAKLKNNQFIESYIFESKNDLKIEMNYTNGQLHGSYKEWYMDHLKTQCTYKYGKLHGVYKTFSKYVTFGGIIDDTFKATYKNGILYGSYIGYKNGILYGSYTGYRRIPSFKCYFIDGQLSGKFYYIPDCYHISSEWKESYSKSSLKKIICLPDKRMLKKRNNNKKIIFLGIRFTNNPLL